MNRKEKLKIRAKEKRKEWEKKGLCIYCGKTPAIKNRKGCQRCLERKVKSTVAFGKKHPDRIRDYKINIRHKVLIKYGGVCKCCNESNLYLLNIDHINQDGAEERKRLYGANVIPITWYTNLLRDVVRKDLQVLCYNCNIGSYKYKICPHNFSRKK